MTKPTIPEVLADFRAYYRAPGNGAWGSLHIVLDDGNYKDDHVRSCIEYAQERNDPEGERLANVLLTMSQTQRRKIAEVATHPSVTDVGIQSTGMGKSAQPDLHSPGWPEMRFHGRAETDGIVWWYEERLPDGSIKRRPLQPYHALAEATRTPVKASDINPFHGDEMIGRGKRGPEAESEK